MHWISFGLSPPAADDHPSCALLRALPVIIHLPKWFCPQSSACVEEVRGGIVPDRVDGGVDGRVDGGRRHEEPYLDEPADLRAGLLPLLGSNLSFPAVLLAGPHSDEEAHCLLVCSLGEERLFR